MRCSSSRQEDLPDRRGRRAARIGRAIIEQFEGAEAAMAQHKGVWGQAQRRRDQRRRLLLAARAGRVPRPAQRRDAQLHGAQPRGAARAHVENQTDLAVMVRPPTDMDTLNQPFAPHPYVIVAAASHPRRLPGAHDRRRRCASPSSCASEARTPGSRCGGLRWRPLEPAASRGDLQHRDDQAGRDGRHGPGVPVGAHGRGELKAGQPARARRAGPSADAQLVRRAPAHQAPAAGGAGVQGVSAGRRRGLAGADDGGLSGCRLPAVRAAACPVATPGAAADRWVETIRSSSRGSEHRDERRRTVFGIEERSRRGRRLPSATRSTIAGGPIEYTVRRAVVSCSIAR